VKEAEKRLIGKVLKEQLLVEAGEVASAVADPPGDIHGTAKYRRDVEGLRAASGGKGFGEAKGK